MRVRTSLLTIMMLSGKAASAFAQGRSVDDTLNVSSLYAGGIGWSEIINNILQTLGVTIFAVSGAAFLVGALMYTAGFISEENKSKGKQLMIGSLYGMAVVLSARVLLNVAYYFVYDA